MEKLPTAVGFVKMYGMKDAFKFEYPVPESLDEAINNLGEQRALDVLRQRIKSDIAAGVRETIKHEALRRADLSDFEIRQH